MRTASGIFSGAGLGEGLGCISGCNGLGTEPMLPPPPPPPAAPTLVVVDAKGIRTVSPAALGAVMLMLQHFATGPDQEVVGGGWSVEIVSGFPPDGQDAVPWINKKITTGYVVIIQSDQGILAALTPGSAPRRLAAIPAANEALVAKLAGPSSPPTTAVLMRPQAAQPGKAPPAPIAQASAGVSPLVLGLVGVAVVGGLAALMASRGRSRTATARPNALSQGDSLVAALRGTGRRVWTGTGTYTRAANAADKRPTPQWYAYDGVHGFWCSTPEEAVEFSRRRHGVR